MFGRVTNGAANDLEKVTQVARSMVFEWGMGEIGPVAHAARRQLRAVGGDQAAARHRAGPPDRPRHAEAGRLLAMHRPSLDRVAAALLEKETLTREELIEVFGLESSPSRGLRAPSASFARSLPGSVPGGCSRGVPAESTTSGIAVEDLDEADRELPSGSSAPSSSIARRSPTRASRQRRCASATSRIELLRGARAGHARRHVPRGPRARDAPRRVSGRRRRRGARAARRRRGRADRRGAAARASSACRSRSFIRRRPAAFWQSWSSDE